ncbi:MAG: hypothetical protein ABIR56_10780 [Polaromonas sp.]
MSLKLHRACKVIGFTQKEMPNGWPQAFSLEHIAKLQFPENASDESIFFRALKAACTGNSLKHIATIELREHKLSASVQHHYTEWIRHELRDNSYEVTVHYVDHRVLAAWLEKQGEEPSVHLTAWIEATTPETPVLPVVALGASDGVEPDAGQLSATQATIPSPAPVATVIRHYTKTRRNALTPVIELAQKNCRNPQDTAEVWAALLVLAEGKHAPLLGATENGLQYLKGGTAANLTRDALGKRLTR